MQRREWALTVGFIVASLLIGAWVGVGQLRGSASSLDRLEYLTLDWRFLAGGARPTPTNVVIAAVDDRTLSEDEAHSFSRSLMAKIIHALAVLQPRVVVVDAAFPDAKEGDAELAEALKTTTSIVAAVGLFGDEGETRGFGSIEFALAPRPSRVLWPTNAIRDAAAQIGLANVSTDANGVPRYVPLIFEIDDDAIPSLALAAVSAASGSDPVFRGDAIELAGKLTQTDLGYHMPLKKFYGDAQSFPHFSAQTLLMGALDPESVRGKIVVVGVTASGLADMFATPFDRIAPGATIFATAIANLAHGDALIRTSAIRTVDATTTIVLPVALIGLLAVRRIVVGLAIAVLVVAIWIAGVFLAFTHGYWLAMAPPIAVGVPLATAYVAARLVMERAAGAKLAFEKSALAKFQSPALVDHILKRPDFLEKPLRGKIAVLFLDLTGSTAAAEMQEPERAGDLLHGMQTLVEGEISSHGGVVINYMGDGVLAAFGVPASKPDDAARALAAVDGLRDRLIAWLADWPDEASAGLDFRIGAHFGPAMISRLGSPTHQQITIAGDTVNVASRLLEVAKAQHCRIVVSEDLFAAASETAPNGAYVSLTVPIRGREGRLGVRTRD